MAQATPAEREALAEEFADSQERVNEAGLDAEEIYDWLLMELCREEGIAFLRAMLQMNELARLIGQRTESMVEKVLELDVEGDQ
jgi:hypothetical protein